MNKIVKVISVLQDHEQEKKDGGSYLCTLLTYSDAGKTFNKPFHSKILENNKILATVLHSLKPGDNIEMTQVKTEAGYWNVTGIEKVDKSTSSAGSNKPHASKEAGVRGSFADNALGQQVGNALTNATNLIVAQSDEVKGMSLLDAARHVIRMGEQLKAEVLDGSIRNEKKEVTKPKAPATKKKVAPKVVEEVDDEEMVEIADEEIEY